MTGASQDTDAGGLAVALAARGYPCVVDARERLALLLPSGTWPALDDAAARRAVFGIAAQFGFTHVALEVPDGGASSASGASDASGGSARSRA